MREFSLDENITNNARNFSRFYNYFRFPRCVFFIASCWFSIIYRRFTTTTTDHSYLKQEIHPFINNFSIELSFLRLFTTASLFSIVCQTTLNNKSQEPFQRSITLLSSIVIIATLSSFVWHQTVQPNLIKTQEISNNEGSYPILLWEQSSAIYNYLRWKLILCSSWKLLAQSCM